jgi:XTP/dITP diphosphohydrolase
MTQLVLASQSPRRLSLLRAIGIEPIVSPSNEEEIFDTTRSPEENARLLAETKARSVATKWPNSTILAADTIVYLDGILLGKPSDPKEAFEMLKALSGKRHQVYTGVAILRTNDEAAITDYCTFTERTHVDFFTLSAEQIQQYIQTGSPFDKAGGYGIQDDQGMLFVKGVEGDYQNVIGLPLAYTRRELERISPDLFNNGEPADALRTPRKESIRPSESFAELVRLVDVLRRECPWDREQTPDSVKGNLIEEAYEVVDAIEKKNPAELRGELGDLLLHVLFQTKMASEKNDFSIDEVIRGISEKLIRRHPHVFGDKEVEGSSQVAQNWEQIKLNEGRESLLSGIPSHLPALLQAQRMQEKASNVGFDWSEWTLAWEKLQEELDEFREELMKAQNEVSPELKEEFGDLLFSIVNVGRLVGLHAEDSLRECNQKFKTRFQYIEAKLRERGSSLQESSLEEMDQLWNEAKIRPNQ